MTMKPLTKALLYISLAALLSVVTTSSIQAANTIDFVSDPKVREMAISLCIKMARANAEGKDIVKTMEDKMLTHLGLSRATPKYQDKLIAFYNANDNDFICRGRIDSTTRTSEHIMKRALALSIHNKVFDGFFFNTDDIDVDFNAVEWVTKGEDMHKVTHTKWGTGEPETIVDYLDKILADPKESRKYVVTDIMRLRKDIVKYYGGKTAKELGY
jgi:hypothetical protein